MEDDVGIDSRLGADGIFLEYKDKVVEFSQTKEVDHHVTLSSILFQDEGVDLVHVVSIVRGFEVHERDSHVHRLYSFIFAHDVNLRDAEFW
jgi:hypothetical protein